MKTAKIKIFKVNRNRLINLKILSFLTSIVVIMDKLPIINLFRKQYLRLLIFAFKKLIKIDVQLQ